MTEKGEARLYFVYSRALFCPKFHIQVPFLSMGLSNSPSRKRAPFPRVIILGAAAAAADTSPISWDPSPWEHLGRAVVYMCTQGVHVLMHTHAHTHLSSERQTVSSGESHFFPPGQTAAEIQVHEDPREGGGIKQKKKKKAGAPKMFHHNHSAALESAVNSLAGVPPLLRTNIVQMRPGAMCFFKAGRSRRVESPRRSVIFVLNLLGIVEC